MNDLLNIRDESTDTTGRQAKVYDPSQFNYMADSRGYMLTYRNRPIGGAGSCAQRRRHWRNIQKNLAMYSEQAQGEVEKLKAGCGQARFWANVHMIEASHLSNSATTTATLSPKQ